MGKPACEPAHGERLLGGSQWPSAFNQELMPGLLEADVVARVRGKQFPNEKPSPRSKMANRVCASGEVLCREK